MANIRGVQGGQAIPVAITAVESGVDLVFDAATIALGASENHIGAVGGNSIILEFSPILSAAGTYAPGDYIGESGVCMSVDLAGRVNGGTGIIQSAILIDSALQSKDIELWLFSASVTPPTDNEAWSISDSDANYCIGVIPFTTYYASALNSVSIVGNIGLVYKTPIASQYLFGCLVSRENPTFAAGDITIKLGLLQD